MMISDQPEKKIDDEQKFQFDKKNKNKNIKIRPSFFCLFSNDDDGGGGCSR